MRLLGGAALLVGGDNASRGRRMRSVACLWVVGGQCEVVSHRGDFDGAVVVVVATRVHLQAG